MKCDESDANSDSSALRNAIQTFIKGRLLSKVEKLAADDLASRSELEAQHRPAVWIEDAARRAKQIRVVTHAIKYSHPDARGSSIYFRSDTPPDNSVVGTFSLGNTLRPDADGNAAALDVYKFLSIEFQGKTLLERALAEEPDLREALSEDASQAERWMKAFAGIASNEHQPASHTLAKQIYWLVEEKEGTYHLLAPLFPTSLVQTMHDIINEDRFSEASNDARSARKARKFHPHGYREYPGLAIRRFGGSKPQNISQLNAERRGVNYLLPSLPPSWRRRSIAPPLYVETVFGTRFGRRLRERRLIETLRDFLTRSQHTNVAIRNHRKELVSNICEEVIQFASEIHQIPPGWSAQAQCQLDAAEQYWLDPYRASQDVAFAASRAVSEWAQEISRRFGMWLNHQIRTELLRMGDAEQDAWRDALEDELRSVRAELADE